MKIVSTIRIAWVLSVAIALSGCESTLSGSFKIAEVRIVARNEVGSIIGGDWERLTSGVSMPPRVVFASVVSDVDLVKYIQEKNTSLSVSARVCDQTRRRLALVFPLVYSGGEDVIKRAIVTNTKAREVSGGYQYDLIMFTRGTQDEVVALLERNIDVCLQFKAANMVTIYESKDIVISHALLKSGPGK